EGGTDRGLVANNFLTSTSTSTVYGIYSNANSNLDIYHNSVHLTRSSNGYALYQTGSGNDINIVNNIFANLGGGYAYQVNDASTIGNLDYNDLYTTGSVLARWDNNDQADLAALQSSSGKEANSASINPGFISDTDLHATTAGLDNLGTPLVEVTMDIDGQMRDNSTPDIGADEFDGNNNAPQLTGPLADIQFAENSDRQLVTSRLDTVFTDADDGDTLIYDTKTDNPKIYTSLIGDSLFVSAVDNYQGEGNVMVYGIDRWGLSAVDTIHVMVTEATALDDLVLPEIPTEFSLQQNYPNPFNPMTTIRYALPEAGHVTLTIYNGLGQKVAVLSEGRQEAGYHKVQFNASGMASGVYYYRLQMDNEQQFKRMILLK
ncbi:MAG: T9SS type A sorting domain-containing protein, partial [Caldithrix sp.]|nr:T9SS type A sorting domain-containing protein [Caldithrix sp.]